MPYKPFEPKDSLEAVMSKLWGDPREVNPKTRLEEIILKIANAQPTGIHAVPDIEEADVGKVLTAGSDGAVWSTPSGGGGGGSVEPLIVDVITDPETYYNTLDETFGTIKTAFLAGTPVIVRTYNTTEGEGDIPAFYGYELLTSLSVNDGESAGGTIGLEIYGTMLSADTDNDYPTDSGGGGGGGTGF